MAGFVLRTLITSLGLWLASEIVPGIRIADAWTLLFAAVLLGFVNAFVRPIFVVLTLPLAVLTLGLFLLVVNAAMLGLVAWLLEGFHVSGLLAGIFGSLLISFTSWMASWFIGPTGRFEVMVVERRT